MDERRGHWWNGAWGRLARRDIWLYTGPWRVEWADGGADAPRHTREFGGEVAARAWVERLMAGAREVDAWREM